MHWSCPHLQLFVSLQNFISAKAWQVMCTPVLFLTLTTLHFPHCFWQFSCFNISLYAATESFVAARFDAAAAAAKLFMHNAGKVCVADGGTFNSFAQKHSLCVPPCFALDLAMSFTLAILRAALIDYMLAAGARAGRGRRERGEAIGMARLSCAILRIHVHRTRPHHFSFMPYPTQWQLCFSSTSSRPIAGEVSTRYSLATLAFVLPCPLPAWLLY